MRKTFLFVGLVAVVLVFVGQGCLSSGNQSATSGPAGMFASVNRGDSWEPISLLPKADGVKNISSASVYRLFTDPQDPTALYWASRQNGFFFSYDEGRTWQQPAGDLTGGQILNSCSIFITSLFYMT